MNDCSGLPGRTPARPGAFANFLLAWHNAEENGGWDPVDLWSVDTAIADDMLLVVRLIRDSNRYPDALGLGDEIAAVWRLWRGNGATRQAARNRNKEIKMADEPVRYEGTVIAKEGIDALLRQDLLLLRRRYSLKRVVRRMILPVRFFPCSSSRRSSGVAAFPANSILCLAGRRVAAHRTVTAKRRNRRPSKIPDANALKSPSITTNQLTTISRSRSSLRLKWLSLFPLSKAWNAGTGLAWSNLLRLICKCSTPLF